MRISVIVSRTDVHEGSVMTESQKSKSNSVLKPIFNKLVCLDSETSLKACLFMLV